MPGRICFRVLKNVYVVEYALTLGCEKVAELVYSDSSFEGDIDDQFEDVNTVSGINNEKR